MCAAYTPVAPMARGTWTIERAIREATSKTPAQRKSDHAAWLARQTGVRAWED